MPVTSRVNAAPTFSVITPTYNRFYFIQQALNSVWGQTYRNYELLVVDDGSIDGTLEYLESLNDRIKLIRQRRRGPGAARNAGVQQASGHYLAFLDSDDLWFPWTLATFALLIRRHDSPAILSAKHLEFWNEVELTDVRAEPARANAFHDYFASSDAHYFVGSGMAVLRRDVFRASNGFIDQRLNAEDHDLILRLGLAPGFVQVLAPVTLAVRKHLLNETSDHKRTAKGITRMIYQERRNAYPGGTTRARERQEIITLHSRPASLGCLRNNFVGQGWRLYCATLDWNARLGRWKYLALFPILALGATLRSHRWVTTREHA
jgi:glycosyltransferase involved in cell wall biosynthesis